MLLSVASAREAICSQTFNYSILHMKIICFLLALLPLQAICQAREAIPETQRLAQLCKIWGFLKYYHPKVAIGKQDWDQQLIALIPKVRQAATKEEVAAIYLQLLEELGQIKPCSKCKNEMSRPEKLTRNFDLSFINDTLTLSSTLRQKLLFIKNNRYQGNNYYVKATKRIEQADFGNEKPYSDMKLPEEPYRLLSLFRYWNAIHYFFPYKYAMDKDWNKVLVELIPVFQQATDTTMYPKALKQMIASINDSHGFLNKTTSNRQMGGYYVPFDVKFVNKQMVISGFLNDSLASLHKLKIGTIVTHIDGKSVESLVEEQRKFVPASNEAVFYRNLKYTLLPGRSPQVSITMLMDGREETQIITRCSFSQLQRYTPESRQVCEWLTKEVGYVNMGKLEIKQVNSVMTALQDSKTIIFDLRNSPKGTMYQVSRFLNPKPVAFAKFTKPDFSYPGMYDSTYHFYTGRANKAHYKGKVLLLVDEETQSQAEFTTMILQTSPNATIVGSQTAGADGDICWLPLPGGYRTAFSGLGVYYPDGRETQRIGIVPDVGVLPTVQGIGEGRDEVLEKALEIASQSQ
jgi:C-terminal processing protease CtpA/Prc